MIFAADHHSLPPVGIANEGTVIFLGKLMVNPVQQLDVFNVAFYRPLNLRFCRKIARADRIFFVVCVQFPAEFAVKRNGKGMQAGQHLTFFIHSGQRLGQQLADEPAPAILRPGGDAGDASHRQSSPLYVNLQRKQSKFGQQFAPLKSPPGLLGVKPGLLFLPILRRQFILEGIFG